LIFGSVSLTLVGWRLAEVVDELQAGDSSLVTPDRRDSFLPGQYTKNPSQNSHGSQQVRYSYHNNMSVVRESSSAKIDHHNASFTLSSLPLYVVELLSNRLTPPPKRHPTAIVNRYRRPIDGSCAETKTKRKVKRTVFITS
jgi:hypothetical protein